MSNLFNVSSIPLHVNQYNYQMNSNETYLVIETYSNILFCTIYNYKIYYSSNLYTFVSFFS